MRSTTILPSIATRSMTAAALCNDSRDGSGDPIDAALAVWVEGYNRIRANNPRRWVYPFDTRRRLMATANVVNGEESFYVKGAYEELKKHAENASALGDLEFQIEAMAGRGLRVLRSVPGGGYRKTRPRGVSPLPGIVGFIDPPKRAPRKRYGLRSGRESASS